MKRTGGGFSSDVTTCDFRSCWALPSQVQIRHAALPFKIFSAPHPERLPSFSISSSLVLFFVLLPQSFSFTKPIYIFVLIAANDDCGRNQITSNASITTDATYRHQATSTPALTQVISCLDQSGSGSSGALEPFPSWDRCS